MGCHAISLILFVNIQLCIFAVTFLYMALCCSARQTAKHKRFMISMWIWRSSTSFWFWFVCWYESFACLLACYVKGRYFNWRKMLCVVHVVACIMSLWCRNTGLAWMSFPLLLLFTFNTVILIMTVVAVVVSINLVCICCCFNLKIPKEQNVRIWTSDRKWHHKLWLHRLRYTLLPTGYQSSARLFLGIWIFHIRL